MIDSYVSRGQRQQNMQGWIEAKSKFLHRYLGNFFLRKFMVNRGLRIFYRVGGPRVLIMKWNRVKTGGISKQNTEYNANARRWYNSLSDLTRSPFLRNSTKHPYSVSSIVPSGRNNVKVYTVKPSTKLVACTTMIRLSRYIFGSGLYLADFGTRVRLIPQAK